MSKREKKGWLQSLFDDCIDFGRDSEGNKTYTVVYGGTEVGVYSTWDEARDALASWMGSNSGSSI